MRYTSIRDLLADCEAGHIPKLSFAHHALERGVEMGEQLGLGAEDIRNAMTAPDHVHFSEKYQAVLLQSKRCTLSVDLRHFDGEPVVVTILWTSAEDWIRSYATNVDGRQRREIQDQPLLHVDRSWAH